MTDTTIKTPTNKPLVDAPDKYNHAALRAEYMRQRDAAPCELEFYLWERKDKGMADFAKLGVPPAFFPFHEYRCTDISCYVSKDGGTAIRMLRTNAQALQRKLGGTANWYYPTAIKAGPWNLDFDGKGTYTYRTKATINFLPPDPPEDTRTDYEIGLDEGRKQALEDVANGFIKQKSWTQDMAHAVVQHAALEGAFK
jgi:hypothetical protein